VRRASPLDRKLLRDLWFGRGQALAVALVIGAGIAVFVAMLSTFASLDLSLQTYYDRYRFGDVFVSLKRAPLSLVPEIESIPGVAAVEPRVVVDVNLDVAGMQEPAIGRLISLPADRRPLLCDVFLRQGRYLAPGHPDEVLASEGFARAHHFAPGDSIGAVINGRRRSLRIVGFALSPEYVYQIRPGELFPDEARFAVLWMERRALASAFQMEGAFNDLVVKVMHDSRSEEVIPAIDRVVGPRYGGGGAIPRSLQTSHWYLNNELQQLRSSGVIVPVIFLGVAAFLLNVVLSRIVSVQRPQIAALKALGYGNVAVAFHFIKWSLVVSAAGALVGVAGGAWFGWATTELYIQFFHFPILLYRLDAPVLIGAAAIGVAAAVLGALGAVRRAVSLPPAEAMRPEPPARFSETWIERAGLRRLLSQPGRIVLRTMQRHPARSVLSVVGIALGASLLVVGNFSVDAIDVIVDRQFNVAQRYDVMVSLVEPASAAAFDEFASMPGVMIAEPFRVVPARLRVGTRSRMVAIAGVAASDRLNRIVDVTLRPVVPVPDALVLSDGLATLLGVSPGDRVEVDVLEGRRVTRELPVARVVREYIGISAYMDRGSLHRLMDEGASLSGAYLKVDPSRVDALYRELKSTPRVGSVLLKRAAVDSLRATMAEMMRKVQAIYVLFATIIAFGVVYNSARISLAERSRELATLRVIGFTRGEISYVLLGEFAILAAAAVPLGFALGHAFVAVVVRAMNTEMFRLPVVVSRGTYAFAGTTILLATALSALIVRRRLDRLDLVEVLKTRE
jgi:putative ABC transport system permease protein